MNETQKSLLEVLEFASDTIAKYLAEHNPADIFPERVDDVSEGEGKIINVNLGFSFQSEANDVRPEIAVQDISIGGRYSSKHPKYDNKWKEI